MISSQYLLYFGIFIVAFILYFIWIQVKDKVTAFLFPKSKTEKEKYVKICPNCGNTKVRIPPAGMDMKMIKQDYCKECGNWGNFPKIREDEIEKYRKKLSK